MPLRKRQTKPLHLPISWQNTDSNGLRQTTAFPPREQGAAAPQGVAIEQHTESPARLWRNGYAARTVSRNLVTSILSRVLSLDSDRAEACTCADADPVSPAPRCTSRMLDDTSEVPRAALWILREISCVEAPCSSTAEAMVAQISDMREIVSPMSLIAPTDSSVAAWMPEICWLISPVAFAVCSASAFTSAATTAKPRPASPARAASMVAFSARRLVWPAILLINSTTSPIRAAAFDNSLTRALVFWAWPTASRATRDDSCT